MEFIKLNSNFEYWVDARHVIKSVLNDETGLYMLRQNLISKIADNAIRNDLINITETSEVLRLPNIGEPVTQGIYYVSEWGTLLCRQTHNMTIYNPIDIPALFSFYREDTGDLEWIQNEQVNVGDYRFYEGVKYEVIQAHQTQSDWTPDVAVTLWKVWVDPDAVPDIAEWVQPGSTNPYMKGDKVLFNGNTYESVIDNNVWSPTGYPAGWRKI